MQPNFKLIKSEDEAKKNIAKFNRLLDEYDPDDADSAMEYIINNLASFRAWYTYWDEKEQRYLFAPSKYIGYSELTPELYNEYRSTHLDGRKTENILSRWFESLTKYDESYDDLTEELEKFLAEYGKSLNTKFRLSVIESKTDNELLQEDLIELIHKVYLGLSEESRETLKNRIINK